ncbi:structure specific recognition protein I, putative [Eimeria maxima]|uniref:FACT complex subunit SSRP1 n=1 Tax=Eimeria maxima TaxID=5804 RepID=U6MBD2_EIMMA|nr:structure specific recognition protein I, putative [Eimeria maxima]CDJ60363.1 structure specific recognition protein I, putative [Eimeria maxima]
MSQGTPPAGPGGPVVSVANIRGLGRNDPGLFKMSGEIFGWKNRRNGKVYQYKSSDVADAQWIHCGADHYQLKIVLGPHRNDSIVMFDGFHKKNYEDIRRHFLDHFKLNLTSKSIAHLGWHWGDVSMDGNNLNVSVNGCPAFEVNAQDIVQVTTPSKNDLAIELVQDDTRDQTEDMLLEIRLFQPAAGDDETDSHLQSLKEKLVKKSGVAETKMESIALLNDVPLLVPRGRYEIDIGRRALKFHGKSYDYTILYTNINRMFLVPRPNSPHVNFILSLDNAMRQGQTSYPFVVMQFDSENVTSVEVNLEEAELKEKGLEKQLEGKTFDVITRILKSLIGKSVIVPGDFKSVKNQYGITCSYRAQSGHLYPLNRSFLFIVKPVIFVRMLAMRLHVHVSDACFNYVPLRKNTEKRGLAELKSRQFEDVVSVEFSRTGASTTNRFFAFTVSCRGGVEHEFTSIDRNEYTPLVEFLTQRGIRIKNVENSNAQRTGGLQEEEIQTDEDDDDYGGEESETDEDFEDEDDDEESEASAADSNDEDKKEKEKKRKHKHKKDKKEKKKHKK